MADELRDNDDLPLPPLVVARCCRDWPVLGYVRLGRCGICGEVPTLTEERWKDEI